MKKLSIHKREHDKRRQQRRLKVQKRVARVAKHHLKQKKLHTIVSASLKATHLARKNIKRVVYQKRNYRDPYREVVIDQEFGIEEPASAAYFLKKAEEIVNFRSRELFLNIKDCPRLWPSAITLLCSLKQWVELTSSPRRIPNISSSTPSTTDVDAYLGHCGFYDYVRRAHNDDNKCPFSNEEIVKIEREKSHYDKDIEKKEDQLISLLQRCSNYSCEEIELFDSVILTEVFNNVREHGIVHKDEGWWLLAQYHKKHNIISFCVADNGIGVRHSLMTGPQRFEIMKEYPSEHKKDGDLIRIAMNQNISGAMTASLKTRHIISQRYERGARRGHGLGRIRDACKKLNISLSIISHRGYVFLDEHGEIIDHGSRPLKIFAGTLYHFVIPAK